MSDMLQALTLTEARTRLMAGTLTPSAYAATLLAHTAGSDTTIHAWATLDADRVRGIAARLDLVHPTARRSLHGIPVGVKDIIDTTDLATQMGSSVYAGHLPAKAAKVVDRLEWHGAYVFGKTVTTEFAFLQPGDTTNPWDARHTPGGSSSGSAAAVAAGHVPAAIGTQTNGSVIRPAAFCGVVGFKPTHDVIPLAGVHLFSQTLDTVGTFTRRVADAAWLAAVIADTGRIAPAILPRERPPRLAVIPGYPWTTIATEADALLDATATRLRLAGAEVVPAVLPEALGSGAKVLRTIMLYEAARNLRPLLEQARPQLSSLLVDALDEGAGISAVDYAGALAARKAMIAAALAWLSHYDAVISPPATGTAPEGLGSTGDPGCCSLWSLLGFPAITIPIGRAANGLPLGLQIAAPMHGDDGLLAVAAWCEQKLPFRGWV